MMIIGAGGPPFVFDKLTTTEGAPSLRSLQEPALSAVEGVGTTDANWLGFSL